jgi:hypothetical protein
MRRIRQTIKVDSRDYWTMFDTGASTRRKVVGLDGDLRQKRWRISQASATLFLLPRECYSNVVTSDSLAGWIKK